MLWRVRTTLPDRPGALAALARRCGDHGVNILALQVFPRVDGVTDELVLRAPDEWGLAQVAATVESAGGRDVTITPCTAHALEDPTTRHLRAAARLLVDPQRVVEVLADVLDADEPDPSLGPLQDTLDLAAGDVPVQVRRLVPFTEPERARAQVLTDIADQAVRLREENTTVVPSAGVDPIAGRGLTPTLRLGHPMDATAVVRMHDRCSAGAIRRRFHTPLARIGWRLAARLVAPPNGISVVADVGGEIVGLCAAAPVSSGLWEIGVLVEDEWQRRGVGSSLLHLAARLSRGQGAAEVVCHVQRDNPPALATLRRAGLQPRVALDDGTVVARATLAGVEPLLSVDTAEAAAPAPV